MTSIKIVVGAAIAAFLAVNVFGAVALVNGVSAFDRIGNVAERFTDDDRQTEQSEYRDGGDFDGGDFDGGNAQNVQMPPQNFTAPPPGFFNGKGKGGKGKGGKGGEKAWEMAFAVQNANLSPSDAEEVALGEVSGQVVETKLKGKDGFPHYEVEVMDGGGQLHEVLVEAREGNITGRKLEKPEKSFEMAFLLEQVETSREEAEDIATGVVPGTVVENELDDENGFAVWEIKILDESGGMLYEVEVGAQNGDVFSFEPKN